MSEGAIPAGAAVRSTASGRLGKVMPPTRYLPRWKVRVLFDGMDQPVAINLDRVDYIAEDYAIAKTWEADHVG